MLQLSYKYSNAIDAKGENYSTASLIMSLLLEQYKIRMISLSNNTNWSFLLAI